MNRSLVSLFILIIVCLFAIGKGCDPLYFIPPPKSVLTFSIDNYNGVWVSNGAESVGDESTIQFSSQEKTSSEFDVDNMVIWLKKPVTLKQYDKNDARITIYWRFEKYNDVKEFFNDKDPRTKIAIDLRKWSNKPRGLIEGAIDATFYDDSGKAYNMKGYFKAYQALGTINSFH